MEQLVKKIKEEIRLDQCQKGDRLFIGRRAMRGATKYMSSSIIVEKIKPIQNGMVQIKYQSQYGNQNKIHKLDVGGESIVERTRNWVPADGEDKGYYNSTIITYEGVQYRVTSPEEFADIPARAERNRVVREAREKEEREAFMADPLIHIGIDPGAYLGIFANFLDARIRKVADVPQIGSDDNMKRVTDSKNVSAAA